MAQKRLGSDDADFIMKLGEVRFSNSEIARNLGVTEGAIRYRIKRRASGEPDGRVSKPSELDGFREWIGTWSADYEGSRRAPACTFFPSCGTLPSGLGGLERWEP